VQSPLAKCNRRKVLENILSKGLFKDRSAEQGPVAT